MRCLVNVCGTDHWVSEGRAYWSGTLNPVAPLIAATFNLWDSLLPWIGSYHSGVEREAKS